MIIALTDRVIFEITGDLTEIKNFFQGITTNDINLIDIMPIYSLFLIANGRFLFDVFFIKYKNQLLIDCNEEIADRLFEHVKVHRMRKKFEMKRTKYYVYSKFNNIEIKNESIIVEYQDSRAEVMGYRIITTNKISANNDLNLYHQKRIQNLVVDGFYDMAFKQSLPINFNMHNLNAISLNKGCYIGQETINRLFRTSVIRKKLVCLEIQDSENNLSKNSINFNLKDNDKIYVDNIECGIICSQYGKYILSLIDISFIDNSKNYVLNNDKFMANIFT